ncbi:MAG: hypothetical protein HN531_09315 [Opitutae bacterium]|nr:hypothetical protein [Opitutae bacterium]
MKNSPMFGMGRRQFLQLGASGLLLPDYFNLLAHLIYDRNDRPLPMCDGSPLPIFS